ncbi:MAG TPA: NUDIX domain-containing protein [Allosphingosinicella sp.]|nr:NUDIX domain-containing protein [Allosphingosinicella sp.]
MSLPRRLMRIVFTFLYGLHLAVRKAAGRRGEGVHAVPLTESGKVVLVLLTYAPRWRLPGGGLKRGEAPEEAILRELREEIGLLSHGGIERLDAVDPEPAVPGDRSAFFLVRDVVYRPRRSLEVESVGEFDPDRLPPDTARGTALILEQWRRLTAPAAPPAGG